VTKYYQCEEINQLRAGMKDYVSQSGQDKFMNKKGTTPPPQKKIILHFRYNIQT
jgi:hypothetical protein